MASSFHSVNERILHDNEQFFLHDSVIARTVLVSQ